MCRNLFFSIFLLLVAGLVSDASGTLVPSLSITAQAASQFGIDTGPEKSIDGSGMLTGDYRLTHNNTKSDMWLSAAGGVGSRQNHPFGLDCSTWIMYEFDQPYRLGAMRVYNYNEWNHTAAGLWNVYIHYSLTGGAEPGEWITLGGAANMYSFSQASGRYGERGKNEADFRGALAKYALITAAVNNGNFGHPYYGLAEVQFNIIPEPATLLLLGLGSLIIRRLKFKN